MAAKTTVMDAAVQILTAAGGPLHYKEIAKQAIESGRYVTDSRQAPETFHSILCHYARNQPEDCAVVRTGPGTWGLRAGGGCPALPNRRQRRAGRIEINPDEQGHLVLFRGRDAFVRPVDLEQILATHGIDWVAVPKDLDQIQRAIASISSYRTARATGRPTRIEILSSDADSVTFGVLFREEIKAGAEVGWVQHEVISYGKAGWSTATLPESLGFVVHASRWQTHLDNNWLRDRVFVRGFQRLGGFSVAGGGLYYVHGHDAELRTLRTVARVIGGSDLSMLPVGADQDSQDLVGQAAVDSVLGKVGAVLGKLAQWREKSNGKTTSLQTMLSELGELREHAAQLAGALRFSTEELETAFNDAVDEVQASMAGPSVFDSVDLDETPVVEPPTTEARPEAAPEAPGPVQIPEVPEAPQPAPIEAPPKAERKKTSRRRNSTPPAPPIEATPPAVEPPAEPVATPPAPAPEADPFAGAEAEDGGPYMPTIEEIENGGAPKIRVWAQGLGIELRNPETRKPKSSLVLATEIAALREARASGRGA